MCYHLPCLPELSSTNVTSITLYICLFMCKIHLKYCYINCVKIDFFFKYKKKSQNPKHMQKPNKHILVPSQRYQDSWHLLQNPKVPRNVMGFSNCAHTFTPLNYLGWDSPFEDCQTPPKNLDFSSLFVCNHSLLWPGCVPAGVLARPWIIGWVSWLSWLFTILY